MMASGLIALRRARNSSLALILSGWVMGRESFNADSLTGEGANARPRPFGRSGCVTTRGIRNPSANSFSRVGTAKRGVPQKTRSRDRAMGDCVIESFHHFVIRKSPVRPTAMLSMTKLTQGLKDYLTKCLPFSGLHQLFDLSLHQITLQCAEMAEVELAVEMVGFVQKSARQQLLARFLVELSVYILGADRGLIRTSHVLSKIRNAQASFALYVLAFRMNDLRIDENELGIGVFFERHIDDGDAPPDADLRRGKPDSMGLVHRLKHVLDQLFQFTIEDRNFLRWSFENRIAVLHDGIDHQ